MGVFAGATIAITVGCRAVIIAYRREIDGLRALAVVPVVFFHAGFEMFAGGFVGVDVFFVISGYLITSIILAELKQERFSIIRFYERRARRILPALFVVMGVCTLLAYTWMMPDEFKNFGQSILATSLFSNNVLLSLTAGYWDLASEFKPLLHTWSLGVEEQYYFIFPVVMILGWRFVGSKLFAVLACIAVVSLLASIWAAPRYPSAAFYLLPTRAWELLFGALCAIYLMGRLGPQRLASSGWQGYAEQLGSLAGLLLIVASVFIIDRQYAWPGLFALAPTLGAVLIILYARPGTVVHGLLGSKLMVGVGLISYSLYLWHQPLLAFSRVYSRDVPDMSLRGGLIVLTVLLSVLTWSFVEKPFRNGALVGRWAVGSFAVVATAAFILIGYELNLHYGFPERVFDPSVKIAELDKRFYNERAFGFKHERFSSSGKLKVLVVGNSFGRDFVNMTTETFEMKNVELVYRDDLDECISPFKSNLAEQLFGSADVIVFASGDYRNCVEADIGVCRGAKQENFLHWH